MAVKNIADLLTDLTAPLKRGSSTLIQRLTDIIESSYNRLDDAGSGGGLSLGETAGTAYRGDRGKTAYDHSQSAHETPGAAAAALASAMGYTDDEIAALEAAFTILLAGKANSLGADDNYVTDAEKTKLGHISVTQAVDLDDIETRVNNLDAAVVLKGTWDASAGTFPGGGTAQAGASYIVSVGGTVDGVVFVSGDRIIAIVDNASTGTFLANWFKADYTDAVLSVNGSTGAVTVTLGTLGATTVGTNLATLANPSAVTFLRINADNTVTALNAAQMLAAIGAQASGSYLVATNNLSDISNATTARGNLGGTTIGSALFTLANPSAVRFLRLNADNTVSVRTAAELLGDIGAQAAGTYLTSANIVATITKGNTTTAPNESAVYDALTLKGQNNSAEFSQVVVSATAYYITGSSINIPSTLQVGSSFSWDMTLTKTNAGTGTFQFRIYRGTNGTTADTADVTQTIGTQTAVVDTMDVTITICVLAIGATGSYFWTIAPTTKAATATGFGVATGTTGVFSGTVNGGGAGVPLNTANLKFGIAFISTTGTPTIRVAQMRKFS